MFGFSVQVAARVLGFKVFGGSPCNFSICGTIFLFVHCKKMALIVISMYRHQNTVGIKIGSALEVINLVFVI